MNIKWSNGVHRNRSCNITSINDIQKYEEDGFFCLRIKEGIGLWGGILGKFNSVEAREKAYNDIESALDTGEVEFEFRQGYYEHMSNPMT